MKHLLSSSAYIVVNKMLSKRVGLKASVLLADLISKEMYFENRGEIKDGFFFNTSKNIERDTTLSNYKQKRAIQILEDEGFIETKLMGMPATLHFKILQNKIDSFLKTSIKETSKLDLKKLKTNKNKLIRITNKKDITIRKQEFLDVVYLSNLSTELCSEFVDYWTETNKSGNTMKFEMEKTFDIKRRLARWIKNDKKWNKKGSKIESQIDVWQKVNDKLRNG
tara:strand:+ start:932 stop:1600 length:669 start_codon:yes stop_codon:yes gene_type:complete